MLNVLHLSDEEIWAILQGCDPAVIARRALAPAVVRENLTADQGPVPPGGGITMYPEEDGVRAVPGDRLRVMWAAIVAAATAQELVPPGLIIAGVIGEHTVEACLALLVRVMPDLSHVTIVGLHFPGSARVADRLRRYGIGVSCSAEIREAVRGSDVVVFEFPVQEMARSWFMDGSVLIDIGAAGDPSVRAEHVFADRPYPGENDLSALLAGQPRRQASDVVLVRVRGVRQGACELARYLYRKALTSGLGTAVNGPDR